MIGQILNGVYQLTDLIGSGGYANVYRARDLRTEAMVAVKVLHAHFARDRDIAARFEREIGLARQLQTPYVARILDAGRDAASPPYMVMEFVQGRTLAQLVEQRGPLPIPETVEIVDQLLGALKQAHALGIIHRDIKPHNMMLDATGRVRVLDFGVSRAVGAGTITADGQLLGTPEYMAPEQLAGQPIDARADLYAVGAVLYHLLAGRPPYLRTSETDIWEMVRRARREPPPPIQQLRPETPPALVDVVERAMSREADRRYASAFEMQQALAVAAGVDAPTPPPFPTPELNRSPGASAPPPSPGPASRRQPVDDQSKTVIMPILSGLGAPAQASPPQATPPLAASAPAPTPTADTPPTPPPAPLQRPSAAPPPPPPPAHPAPTRLIPQQPPRPPSAGADQTRVMGPGAMPPGYGKPPPRASAPAPPPRTGQPPRNGAPIPASPPGPPIPAGPTAQFGARRPTTPARTVAGWPVWQLAAAGLAALLLVILGAAIGRFASQPQSTASATVTVVAASTAAPTPTAAPTSTAGAQAAAKPTLTPAAPPPAPTAVVAVAPPTLAPPPPTPSPAVANMLPPPNSPGSSPPAPTPAPTLAPTLAPNRPPPAAAPSESEILLADTFDRSEGGLLTRTSPRPNDYVFAYERGEYAIKKVNPTLPAAPIVFVRGEYTDTVIAVDVRIVGEAGARYAFLVCRDTSGGGQTKQYRASIVPEGRRVILSRWGDGEQKVLAESRDNPAIQIGNATNRLELRCAGPKIEAIVNGKTVVSAEDGTLSSGEHGLGAGTFSGVEGTLEARFDNLEVRRP